MLALIQLTNKFAPGPNKLRYIITGYQNNIPDRNVHSRISKPNNFAVDIRSRIIWKVKTKYHRTCSVHATWFSVTCDNLKGISQKVMKQLMSYMNDINWICKDVCLKMSQSCNISLISDHWLHIQNCLDENIIYRVLFNLRLCLIILYVHFIVTS